MIKTKHDLQCFLSKDRERNGAPSLLGFMTWNDNYRIQKLLTYLRYTEYYKNNLTGVHKIMYMPGYIWNYWNLRRMIVKTGIHVFTNTIGSGLQLMHPGFRRIDRFVSMGCNCTILPMVLFGRKNPDDTVSDICVGDNCYISTGVTVLGPVKIGNNVTIGAGAVVTKDIPDNAIVAGVPAKIIRFKC